MKKSAASVIGLMLCVAFAWAISTKGEPLAATGDMQQDAGRVISLSRGKLKLTPVSDSVIRVQYTPKDTFRERESLAVLQREPGDVHWSVEDGHEKLLLKTDRLNVEVNRATGALTFLDPRGNVVLCEGKRSAKPVKVMGEDVLEVQQEFNFKNGEALYGLGQFQNGYMNYRGKELVLVQSNRVAVNPFLVSTMGYGILWDNYSKTKFSDVKIKGDGSSAGKLWSEVADGIDYYFIYGPELDEVVSGYRDLTGRAPMFGKWAYGYFQSKERYKSFDEMVEVVAEYRRREIPIDTIVLDWQYWGELGWNPLKFDESGPFKDPAKRIDEIHDLNARIIISIWPNVTDKSDAYTDFNAGGHLYGFRPLTMEVFDKTYIYDAYNEEARGIYWRHLKKNIFAMGMDGFWMDATEPETGFTWTQGMSERAIKALQRCDMGTMSRYLNSYSLMTTGAVYKGWRESESGKRVYILTRSAFSGQQRYAATTWSGDITAKWPVLKKQIAGGLNFCMAGIPYWTTDIGGFFTEKNLLARTKRCEDPDYRELYVRWFQYGAFCPIFRSHGTNTPREVWRFGEPGDAAYDTLVKFDNLRYRLMPYIYSVAWMVTNQGYTMMRGLAMDFRDDPEVYNINDQFMFGPAILVNPVTQPIKRMKSPSREVYLPEAAGWYDFWTGEKLKGGHITAPASLSTMPLSVKAGSIIPLGPLVQYATEKTGPIEVRVYPGGDASFTLYEDENDNYNYEKGIFTTIEFTWNDSKNTLSIGARTGRFPGMDQERTFNVVIVRKGHGTGVAPAENPEKIVLYDGSRVSIGF